MKPFKTTASSIPGVVFSRIERSKRRAFWGPPGQWRWPVIILLTIASAFVSSMLLGSCTFPWGAVPPQRPHAYLPVSTEEDALIRMRLAIVVNMVKHQQYPELFDTGLFQLSPSPELLAQQRRYFLHTHYCAERFLGRLKGYDQSSVQILKEPASVHASDADHRVQRHIIHVRLVTSRDQSPEVEELYTLLQEDLTYKLTGYFIKTRRPSFHDCMARIVYPKSEPLPR